MKIKRLLNRLRWSGRDSVADFKAFRYLLKHYERLGFGNCTNRDLWEADHIVPRVMGGTHDLENLRTLCIPCHKRETKKLAARRAAERRGRDVRTILNQDD